MSILRQNCPPILLKPEVVDPLVPINREHFTQVVLRTLYPITGYVDVAYSIHLSSYSQSFECRLPT
jgi:hypothetical protein